MANILGDGLSIGLETQIRIAVFSEPRRTADRNRGLHYATIGEPQKASTSTPRSVILFIFAHHRCVFHSWSLQRVHASGERNLFCRHGLMAPLIWVLCSCFLALSAHLERWAAASSAARVFALAASALFGLHMFILAPNAACRTPSQPLWFRRTPKPSPIRLRLSALPVKTHPAATAVGGCSASALHLPPTCLQCGGRRREIALITTTVDAAATGSTCSGQAVADKCLSGNRHVLFPWGDGRQG